MGYIIIMYLQEDKRKIAEFVNKSFANMNRNETKRKLSPQNNTSKQTKCSSRMKFSYVRSIAEPKHFSTTQHKSPKPKDDCQNVCKCETIYNLLPSSCICCMHL